MTTTFETKAAQIEAIRNGDLIAIKDWFEALPQNEHAVAKLAVKVLLEKLSDREQYEPMSKKDLMARLIVCESALRVIRATLHEPVGQAMVVLARKDRVPDGTATAYRDEDVDLMQGISDITLSLSVDDAERFLRDFFADNKPAPRKKKRLNPPSSFS